VPGLGPTSPKCATRHFGEKPPPVLRFPFLTGIYEQHEAFSSPSLLLSQDPDFYLFLICPRASVLCGKEVDMHPQIAFLCEVFAAEDRPPRDLYGRFFV